MLALTTLEPPQEAPLSGDAAATGPTHVNIGAGASYLPGFANVDIADHAEISLNLSTDPLPFETSSVDVVYSAHTLEHVDDYLFALSEIHRVLRHGGQFFLEVPYVTLTKYNLVNPYHKHHFNEFSFDFFHVDKLKGSAVEENPVLFEKVFHVFHPQGGFRFVPPPLSGWCRAHLFNTTRAISFGLLAIKSPHRRIEVTAAQRRAMRNELFRLGASRVHYQWVDGTRVAPPPRDRVALRALKARLWK
ncbi:MAG: class I SAM-dependent methyltransferase [Bacteroidota bacterium]